MAQENIALIPSEFTKRMYSYLLFSVTNDVIRQISDENSHKNKDKIVEIGSVIASDIDVLGQQLSTNFHENVTNELTKPDAISTALRTMVILVNSSIESLKKDMDNTNDEVIKYHYFREIGLLQNICNGFKQMGVLNQDK